MMKQLLLLLNFMLLLNIKVMAQNIANTQWFGQPKPSGKFGRK